MTKKEHLQYLRERDIDELISWLGYVREDFIAGKAEMAHQKAVCRMVNILYGRKARPNQQNRLKSKHMRRYMRGWQ